MSRFALFLILAFSLNAWAAPERFIDCEQALNFGLPSLAMHKIYKNEHPPWWLAIFMGREVDYMTKREQSKHEVFVENGLLVDRKGNLIKRAGMFVLLEDGRLIVKGSEDYHHSSLAIGKNVLAAGQIYISEGRVLDIDFQSGHYRPSLEYNVRFVKLLAKNGIRLKPDAVDSTWVREELLKTLGPEFFISE